MNKGNVKKKINPEVISQGYYIYERGRKTYKDFKYKLGAIGYSSEVFDIPEIWKRVVNYMKTRHPEIYVEPELEKVNRKIPSYIKELVYKRDKGKCQSCGSKVDLHFDHIIPFNKGGSSTDKDNIQLLCSKCNLEKGDSFKY